MGNEPQPKNLTVACSAPSDLIRCRHLVHKLTGCYQGVEEWKSTWELLFLGGYTGATTGFHFFTDKQQARDAGEAPVF